MQEVKTEEVEYPCPKCGTYNLPYMHSKGYAMMLCKKCGIQYKTSMKVSAHFRKFCSDIASKPNRSQSYYTSLEKKVKKILERNGYVQGRDYFHNIMFVNQEDKRRKYFVDFYIPEEHLILECNGSIWHDLWNRKESDRRKIKYLEKLGNIVIIITEKNPEEVEKYLRWGRV